MRMRLDRRKARLRLESGDGDDRDWSVDDGCTGDARGAASDARAVLLVVVPRRRRISRMRRGMVARHRRVTVPMSRRPHSMRDREGAVRRAWRQQVRLPDEQRKPNGHEDRERPEAEDPAEPTHGSELANHTEGTPGPVGRFPVAERAGEAIVQDV